MKAIFVTTIALCLFALMLAVMGGKLVYIVTHSVITHTTI